MGAAEIKILVVDDDSGRNFKAQVLRRKGFTVSEASLGRKAIETCSVEHPDLVLIDAKLPDMSGTDVCRMIKDSTSGVAVLQISAAFHSARDRAEALECGADGLLVEPIEPEELVAAVNALLRMRAAEQQLRRVNQSLEGEVEARTLELEETNKQLKLQIIERRKAEEILQHAQKLESLGQLTGGVAHDFNNLLAVIVSSLELVRSGLEGRRKFSQQKMVQLIAAAETAADRGATLTQQLLAFARKSILTTETVMLNEVIEGCAEFLRRALGETVTLEISFKPGLWPCRIDLSQFQTALLNLVVNARDAMPEGGELDIETDNIVVDSTQPDVADGLTPGNYVRIRISDTGTGMSDDVIRHAFEPFFTTKGVGRGSGLGLSQVYGFVKQSGGHVAIDSTIGSGTTFTLYLPRFEALAANEPAPTGTTDDKIPTGTETILVVEDNKDVLDTTVTVIEDLGYHVLVASDGHGALAHIRGGQKIDLLFTDIVMPGGMSGFDLVREAQLVRRGLPALVASGYSSVYAEEIESGELPLIHKPYRRAELARKIRSALNRNSPTVH